MNTRANANKPATVQTVPAKIPQPEDVVADGLDAMFLRALRKEKQAAGRRQQRGRAPSASVQPPASQPLTEQAVQPVPKDDTLAMEPIPMSEPEARSVSVDEVVSLVREFIKKPEIPQVGPRLQAIRSEPGRDETKSTGAVMVECAFCLKQVAPARVIHCSQCRVRIYCSGACRTDDWQGGQFHQRWCKAAGEAGHTWQARVAEDGCISLYALKAIPQHTRVLVDRMWDPTVAELAEHIMRLRPQGRTFAEKVKVNGFSSQRGGVGRMCVQISRARHSCDPNVEHVPIPEFGVCALFTTRDILPGEEIRTIARPIHPRGWELEVFIPRELRAAALKENWNIVCPPDCVCNNPRLWEKTLEIAETRDRLQKQAALRSDPHAAIAATEYFINAMHEVQRDPVLRTLYSPAIVMFESYAAFVINRSIGRRTDAQRWWQVAYDLACGMSSKRSDLARSAERKELQLDYPQ